jgi:hypothetical protein
MLVSNKKSEAATSQSRIIPKQPAFQKIDARLAACGCVVKACKQFNLSAERGPA